MCQHHRGCGWRILIASSSGSATADTEAAASLQRHAVHSSSVAPELNLTCGYSTGTPRRALRGYTSYSFGTTAWPAGPISPSSLFAQAGERFLVRHHDAV